jgi:hypothetical protein
MSAFTSLDKRSDYESLIDYFKNNKDKPWAEWLNFGTVFNKLGKQGLVGILTSKKNPDKQYVFKISQYINYLIQHESNVMKGLNQIALYCPHFCRTYGTIKSKINPKAEKSANPFELNTKYSIEKEVLLCEYLDKSYKFCTYIRATKKINESILYTTIKQVLLALTIAQKKKQLSHYDLHSNNIMMRKCDKDNVFLYVLDEDNQFCVPSFGHYPVLIDFGFSYIKDLDDGPLWPSLGHTHAGFMSDRFDWVADPKLFLVTVSDEIKDIRSSKNSKKLRRIVRNMFFPLDIDWECGWDNYKEEDNGGASGKVLEELEDCNEPSELFKEHDIYCIDLLQSLIPLPLQKQDYTNIKQSYKVFLAEWIKIEGQISSHFYNMYILKGVIDAARTVGAAYHRSSTRPDALKTFKSCILSRIDEVAKFCNPKNINYDKMLCAILVFAKNLEGFLYDVLSKRMEEKQKQYKKLPLQSVEQMYGAIEANIPDNYEYNKNTIVTIINDIDETTTLYEIPEEHLDEINELHPMARGTFIYDLYKSEQEIII